MDRTSRRWIRVVSLMLGSISLIVSCVPREIHEISNTESPVAQTPNPSNTAEDNPTLTITPASQATGIVIEPNTATAIIPALTPTLVQVPSPLPDLLLNLGTDFWDECYYEGGRKEGNDQIWLSTYPYNEFQAMFAKDGIDYDYPRWSPTGDRFAFVESIPVFIHEGDEIPEVNEGTSIWVSDTSGNQIRVSAILPRINFFFGDTCIPSHFISSPPIWSPDEKYIVFTYADLAKVELSYFLVDLGAKTTTLIFTQPNIPRPIFTFPLPAWITSDRLAFVSNTNEIIIVDPQGEVVKNIGAPEEMAPYELAKSGRGSTYSIQLRNNQLLVSFHDSSEIPGQYVSWYLLDLETEEWQPVLDTKKMMFGNPLVGGNQTVTCGTDGELKIFTEGWQVVGTTMLYAESFPNCSSLQLFNFANQDYVSFWKKEVENQVVKTNGIWLILLQQRDPEQKFMVDLHKIPEQIRFTYNNLIYHDWHP